MNKKIALLIATFNRVSLTRNFLKQLDSLDFENCEKVIFVCDGGSNDGTREMIRNEFPHIKLIEEQDSYWCESMRIAWIEATKFDFDYYIWMNDDISLNQNVVSAAVEKIVKLRDESIHVGVFSDPITKKITYSALKARSNFRKYSFVPITSNKEFAVTFNGNLVIIPRNIMRNIGILDAKFRHAFGDIDYGMSAYKKGFSIKVIPDAGFAVYNDEYASSHSKLRWGDIRNFVSHPKGLPFWEVLYFYKKHEPLLWPIYLFWRYLKLIRLSDAQK